MPAEHETMTAEQIEAMKIWTPFWSEADCRKALGVIEAQAASLARLQDALAVAREALDNFAGEADTYDPDEGDGDMVVWATDVTIGALRLARDAMSTIDAALKGAHPAQGGENVG